MYKIIIAGTRTFNNYDLLKSTLNNFIKNKSDIEIVSGTCAGADLLGEKYAVENNLPIKRFPANWYKYGKAAGPIRNKQMAEYADACIVFWDGQSRGTKSMISLAKENGLKVQVILF